MRTACLLTIVAACAACGEVRPDGGLLPQFMGEYRIIELGDAPPDVPEGFGPLSRLSHLSSRLRRTFATASGSVEVRPAVGGEYAEWTVDFDEPAHAIRLVVGPSKADGSFPVWRFEQQPAPAMRPEGTARVSGNRMVADFVSSDGRTPRRILREQWTVTDDGRLAFALEGGVEGATLARVGGFTATRR